jgi:hypothetical protein
MRILALLAILCFSACDCQGDHVEFWPVENCMRNCKDRLGMDYLDRDVWEYHYDCVCNDGTRTSVGVRAGQ